MAFPIVRIIVFLVSLLTLTSCATPPPEAPFHQIRGDYSYVEEYMTWFIHKEMENRNVVGLSVALVDDQQIVWQQDFGYADKEKLIKTSPETRYRAGSVSKLFTAMATMQLVEAGQMDIDRPLRTYLPAFEIKSRFGTTDGITPRTIMTHHSGLPGNWSHGMWSKNPEPFTQLVNEIKDEYVATAPDTVMAYSNLGISLLGHAVQNVSGQVYSEYVSEKLLNPMGMKSSAFATGLSGRDAAKSYDWQGEEVIEYPLRGVPAGGLNTTVADLSRLAMLVNGYGKLQGHRIFSEKSLDTMFTVQNANIPLDFDLKIGLAWFVDDKLLAGKETVYGHGGAVIAHRTSFMVAPESKIGVVILANSGAAPTYKIARKLLQLAWEAKSGDALPEPDLSQDDEPFLSVKNNSVIEGIYSTPEGKVDITKKSADKYEVTLSSDTFDLILHENNQYNLKYRWLGIIPIDLEGLSGMRFTRDSIAGYQVIIGKKNQDRFLAGVKLKRRPINEIWKNRLGSYALLDQLEPEKYMIKDIEFTLEDGFLLIAINHLLGGSSSQVLRIINNNEAVLEGLGRGLGETIRILEDEEYGEILTFSGLRFKHAEKSLKKAVRENEL